jgi:glycosyltransferase involved in cell wall biosynthesis
LQCRALRRFDAVVAVSRPLADRLAGAGVSRDRLALVPNAWEESDVCLPRGAARQALSVDEDRSLIGWAGRLSREKGADVFVEAMAHLIDLPAVASVMGDGPEAVALQRRATALGLGARVAWHGAVPDAARLFRALDVFVLSSRTEGTPMVLLEAMAAGVPIVAARVGGVPDMLSDAEALLIPPQDPIALARAIRAVLVDRSGARVRAAAAQVRLARDFAPEPWLARYEAVYDRVARV